MKKFTLPSSLMRSIMIIAMLCMVVAQDLTASGACCTVSLSGSNKPAVTFVASSGWSHERIAGARYDLRQHAVIGKGHLPLTDRLFLTAQAGVPLRTELTSACPMFTGSLGFLYGIGVGSVVPNLLPSLNLYGSLNYARSVGNLDQTDCFVPTEASFVITEVQAILLGEYEVTPRASLYGGVRFYSGRNKIDNEVKNLTLSGEREGNVSPLLGIRYSLWESVSVIGEGSLGHTRIMSLALSIRV